MTRLRRKVLSGNLTSDAGSQPLLPKGRIDMSLRMACAALLVALAASTPAFANSSAVPEPSTLVLFGMGVAGVIIGRSGGRSRRD